MIKILSQPAYFKTTCYQCGCKYSYEHEDVNESRIVPGVYFTVCPMCKIQNSHDSGNGAVYCGYSE